MDLHVTTPKKGCSLWIEIDRHENQDCDKKKKENVDDCSAVLVLEKFAERPVLNFGKTKLNTQKEATLVIKNPNEYDQIVTAEKVPKNKGFTLNVDFFEVKKRSDYELKIAWIPTEAGNYRELITFRLDAIFCKQVILLGTAVVYLKSVLQPQNRTLAEYCPPLSKKQIHSKKAKAKLGKHRKTDENNLQMTFVRTKSIPDLTELNCIDQTTEIATIRKSTKLLNSPKATVYLRLTPDLQLRSSSSQPETVLRTCEDDFMLNRRQTFVTKPQRNRQCLITAPRSARDSYENFESYTVLTPNQRESSNKFEAHDSLIENPDKRCNRSATINYPKSPGFAVNQQTCNRDNSYPAIPIYSSMSPELNFKLGSPPSSCSNKKSKIPEPIYKLKNRPRRHSDSNEFNDSLEGDQINDFSSGTTDDSETKPHSACSYEDLNTLDQSIFTSSKRTLQITEMNYNDFCGNLNEPRSQWEEISEDKSEEIFRNEDEDLNYTYKVKKCSTQLKSIAKMCNTKALDSRRELFTDQNVCSDTFVMSESSLSNAGKWQPELLQKRKSKKKSGIPSLQRKFSNGDTNDVVKRNPKTSDCGSSKERIQTRKKRTSRTFQQIDGAVSFKPKLTLIKPPTFNKSLTPCHPNPYGAKNIYYDEQWIEKQTQGFTCWLNFILTIPEEMGEGEMRKMVVKTPLELNRDVTFKQAPSREELSIKTYTVQKKMNLLRRKACIMYQSESIIKVITRLEHEIENRRISIRSDKALHADVGIRQKLVELIMNYNSLWLRIGLETVFGLIINLKSNDDMEGLSQFLLNNILNSPIIAKEYAHPTVPHLFKPGYATALKKHSLKKFLLLVYFLDQAKENYLIDFNPCLFNINAKFKSSRDILLAFSRDHLSGEGDLTKHLSYFGYKVSYNQTALDEYDFSVSNLAVDLRNGLRIARAAQLLTQNWGLMTKLRMPAVTRMQKIHNVTCVLNVLGENGAIITDVSAKDIVNGHREKTLSFLWQLMFNFQVKLVLNEEKLQRELKILEKSLQSLNIDIEKYMNVNRLFSDKKIEVLLNWCQLVCAHYNLLVENFTVSFSDGRVICYLIHHYHPDLLPLSEINKETTQSYSVPRDSLSSDDSFSANWTSSLCNEKHEQLLKNEQENIKIALSKILLCGGVPLMIKPNFMSNTIPDEKVMMVFVSYLCVHFIELSSEIRAARVIQSAWKLYRTKCLLQQILQNKIAAATKIQQAIRKHFHRPQMKTQIESAIKIQKFFRTYLIRHKFLKLRHDVITLQAHTRCLIARRKFKKQLQSVVIIQKWTRMFLARKHHKEMKALLKHKRVLKENAAASKIQSAVKSFILRKHIREIKAANIIQKVFRNYLRRKKIEEMKKLDLLLHEAERDAAATSIQSFWRMFSAQKDYKRNRSIIIIVQSCVRCRLARNAFLQKKFAVITIQTWYKSYKITKTTRKSFLQYKTTIVWMQKHYRYLRQTKRIKRQFLGVKNAALVIQDWYRRCKQIEVNRSEFLRLKDSVITIQKLWRTFRKARIERTSFLKTKKAIIIIQRWYRRCKEMKKTRIQFLKMKLNAVMIQQWYRLFVIAKKIRKQFLERKKNAVTIQKWFRELKKTREIREKFLKHKHSAIVIQVWYRRLKMTKNIQSKFIKQKQAALVLQKWYRRIKLTKQIRTEFNQLKRSTAKIQLWYRTSKQTIRVRAQFLMWKKAAIVIQDWYRRTICARKIRRDFLFLKCQVITIQQWYSRSKLVKQTQLKYEKTKHATIIIQQWFKQIIITKKIRMAFLKQKTAAATIKNWYKYSKERNKCRRQFIKARESAICLQKWYRGIKCTRRIRADFLDLKHKVLYIQRYFRRYRETQKCRGQYLVLKAAVITIQDWFRSTKKLKIQRQQFVCLKKSAINIQIWYRSYKEMKAQRARFLQLKCATISIQQWFRSYRLTRKTRVHYLNFLDTVITIQQWYRSCIETTRLRTRFISVQQAVIQIQKWFKRCLDTKRQRKKFLTTKTAAITIQQWYRSCIETTRLRTRFISVQQAVIQIQKWFKRCLDTKRQRKKFLTTKTAAITIQQWYKTSKKAREIREDIRLGKLSVSKIQDWYSRCKETERIRLRFMRMKQASIVIQKWYRKLIKILTSREKLIGWERVVICIQRWYRRCKESHKIRMKFIEKKKAVVLIQNWYKCVLNRKNHQRYLAEMNKSTILIQKYYRNWIGSKRFRDKFLITKKSVILIQNWYLSCKQRKTQRTNFLILKTAAIVIQRFYRKYKMAKKLREKLLITEKAIITIQCFVRGFLCKRKFIQLKRAASIIQKKFRMWKIARYIRILYATVTLQQFIRGHLETKKWCGEFLKLKHASIVIQKNYRMIRCKKEFTLLKMSVMKIESNYLLGRHRRQCENAARVLQIFVRNCLKAKKERELFLKIKQSVIYIQKSYKMRNCRKHFNELKNSAIVIQKNYRMVKCRKVFKNLENAALIFQKNYRRKLYQREFLEIKKSAIVIQKAWRCTLARIFFIRVRNSTIVLQSAWRGYMQRCKYVETLKAVIYIQNWYRNSKELNMIRLKYIEIRLAVIKIQAWFRSRSAVRKYKQIQRTILGLQKYCRLKRVMVNLYTKIWAIEVLQIYWRAVMKGRRDRECFLIMKYSAIVIQSWFRMLRDKHNLRLIKLSAIKIQTNWRMAKIRKKFLQKKYSVIILENWILNCWECRDIREKYLTLKNCVLSLEVLWHKYKTKKIVKLQNEAAIVIQNWYFDYQIVRYYRTKFLQLKYYTIKMQAIRRGCVARRNLYYKREAAIVIQSLFRKWRDKSTFQLIRGCAIVIQRFWRNYILTRNLNEEYLVKKTACIMVQAFIRGSLIRRRFLYVKYSVIIIQSFVRGTIQRKKFCSMKSAAIVIQRYWLRHLLGIMIFTQYHIIRGAAIVIQSYLRGYSVRQKVKNGRFKRCSNFARLSHYYDELLRFRNWKNYHILRGAAITIQAQIRGWLMRKKVKALDQVRREYAAIKIQAAYRSVLARRRLEKERCVCWKFKCKDYVNFAQSRRLQMLDAVGVIERYYQCYKVKQVELLPENQLKIKMKGFSKWSKRLLIQRRWFLMMKTAAIIIQNAWRAWVIGREIRHQFETFKQITVWFQAVVRGYLMRRITEKRKHVRKAQWIKQEPVQKFNLLEKKIASRENYLKCFAAAAKLQLSAISLQHWIRKCSLKKLHKAATIIQAAWRGYKLRSTQNDRKISDARNRINEANQSAVFANTLWNRTTEGLESLFTCRKLSTVWKALNNLNISTRLSPICCERLAKSGGIIIIYQLIEGCNRSIPHTEIIIECISILINLAKHEPCRAQVWQPEGCGITIVKLMKHYFEKNEKIVLKCCSLMWLISRDESCIKQFSHDEMMRKSINNLCAAISRRFSANRGPVKISPIKDSARKKIKSCCIDFSFKPDWVLGQDIEREFLSYVKAFPFIIELMKSWL